MCRDCEGKGERINAKDCCKNCSGKKVVRESKVLEVHVDKGKPEDVTDKSHVFVFQRNQLLFTANRKV